MRTEIHAIIPANALMVIDCQERFLRPAGSAVMNAATQAFRANVADLIVAAKDRGDRIVLVEFDGAGNTVEDIMEAARGAEPIILRKNHIGLMDSENIYAKINRGILTRLGSGGGGIRVAGLQASICVPASVRGMLEIGVSARTLAHGIINHIRDDDESYCLRQNDMALVRGSHYMDPSTRALLWDESQVGDHDNLAHMHLRLRSEHETRLAA